VNEAKHDSSNVWWDGKGDTRLTREGCHEIIRTAHNFMVLRSDRLRTLELLGKVIRHCNGRRRERQRYQRTQNCVRRSSVMLPSDFKSYAPDRGETAFNMSPKHQRTPR
jgi:hypothetical protein